MAKRSDALVKRHTISVYVTAAQKERIEEAAFTREKRASEFLRDLGLQVWQDDQQPKRGRPRGRSTK